MLAFFINYGIIIIAASESGIYAPVAQWIEHRPPEPGALVRFQSGVLDKTSFSQVVGSLFCFFIIISGSIACILASVCL